MHQVAERMHLEQELQQLTSGEGVQSQMQQENDAEDDRVCVVCLESPNTHLLAPCGHQCVCGKCSKLLVGQPCPVCRGICQSAIKVFMT